MSYFPVKLCHILESCRTSPICPQYYYNIGGSYITNITNISSKRMVQNPKCCDTLLNLHYYTAPRQPRICDLNVIIKLEAGGHTGLVGYNEPHYGGKLPFLNWGSRPVSQITVWAVHYV